MSFAWKLYADMLLKYRPEASYEVFFPTDSRVEDFPDARRLREFDGIIWTGADLDIKETHKPTIQAQIDMAALETSVTLTPSPAVIGSVWARASTVSLWNTE